MLLFTLVENPVWEASTENSSAQNFQTEQTKKNLYFLLDFEISLT